MDLNKEKLSQKNSHYLIPSFLFFLVICFGLLFRSAQQKNYFTLKEVRFIESGSSNLSSLIDQKELLAKSGLQSGSSIFKTDLKAIESGLSSIPWIESLQIQRKIPDTVEIRYQTYEAVAFANIRNKLWLISTDGTLLAPVPNAMQYDFPVFSMMGEKKSEDFSHHMQWLNALKKYEVQEIILKTGVEKSVSENYFEILIRISGRTTLLKTLEVPDDESIKRLDRVVQYLFKHKIFASMIDSRAGKKVVVNIGKRP